MIPVLAFTVEQLLSALDRFTGIEQHIQAWFSEAYPSDSETEVAEEVVAERSGWCAGELGGRLCAALAQNRYCSSLLVSGGPRVMVTAIAMGLKQNRFLRSFQMFHWEIDDADGPLLAEAIKSNGSLQKVELEQVKMGRVSGVALADALKHNVTLRSFDCLFAIMDDDTTRALEEAFTQYNVVLQEIRVVSPEWASGWEWVGHRNVEIAKARHALAAIARIACDGGFRSLTEKMFRREVFRFFLPSACKVLPVEFSTTQQY